MQLTDEVNTFLSLNLNVILGTTLFFSLSENKPWPAIWGERALRRCSSPQSLWMAVIWAKLFIKSHHVPLLPAISSLSHLLHLPLKSAAFHAALLLLEELDDRTEKKWKTPCKRHKWTIRSAECTPTRCLRLSLLLSSVSWSIFSFHRSKKYDGSE